MSFVVCIISYEGHRTTRDVVCRETWLSLGGCDYKFILGRDCKNLREDELAVDTTDGWESIAWKVMRAAEWALAQGYSHAHFCSNDCYVCLPRLLASGYKAHDYYGARCGNDIYAGAGGYTLSRKAMKAIVASAAIRGSYSYADMCDGHVLRAAGIDLTDDQRFNGYFPIDWSKGYIATNLGCGTGVFDEANMRKTHQGYLDYRSAELPC